MQVKSKPLCTVSYQKVVPALLFKLSARGVFIDKQLTHIYMSVKIMHTNMPQKNDVNKITAETQPSWQEIINNNNMCIIFLTQIQD